MVALAETLRTSRLADLPPTRINLMRYHSIVARAVRARAPKQRGPRTTLRVPEELARIAERRGKDEGLSRNDVLIRFALIGAQQTERMDALRDRAERRLAAWRSRSRTKAASGFLTPSEFEAAMRLWRQP